MSPELPDPHDIPRGADGVALGGEARWTSYKGAHRPCDRCVKAIHEGRMASHPLPARRRRRGPNGEELMCVQHGERQESRDQLVARRLADLRKSQANKKPR